MKIKLSPKPGHVLLDLDEAGIRLLAKQTFPTRPSRIADFPEFWEEINARIHAPLKINRSGAWRNFGINE